MISRQLYDAFGEIVKEDTLSYSKDGNLTGKCSYDYRINTSLCCDKYKYTNGRLKNGRHSIIGTPLVYRARSLKKGKRRQYNYRYCGDSLIAVKGYYY